MMCIVRGKCALKTILPPLLLLLLLRNGIESRDRSRLGFVCIFITLSFSVCLSRLDDDGDGNGDASIFYREDNNTFVCGGGGDEGGGGGGGNQINCLAPIAQLGLDVELVLAVVSSTE